MKRCRVCRSSCRRTTRKRTSAPPCANARGRRAVRRGARGDRRRRRESRRHRRVRPREAQANPRVRLISLPQNRGYGGALVTGTPGRPRSRSSSTRIPTSSSIRSRSAVCSPTSTNARSWSAIGGTARTLGSQAERVGVGPAAASRLRPHGPRHRLCLQAVSPRGARTPAARRGGRVFLHRAAVARARRGVHVRGGARRHFPRRAGAPTGASLVVIGKAFREMWPTKLKGLR